MLISYMLLTECRMRESYRRYQLILRAFLEKTMQAKEIGVVPCSCCLSKTYSNRRVMIGILAAMPLNGRYVNDPTGFGAVG